LQEGPSEEQGPGLEARHYFFPPSPMNCYGLSILIWSPHPGWDIRAVLSRGPEGLEDAAASAAEKSITINRSPLHTLDVRAFIHLLVVLSQLLRAGPSLPSLCEVTDAGWDDQTLWCAWQVCKGSSIHPGTRCFFMPFFCGIRREGEKEGYLLEKWHKPRNKTSRQDLRGGPSCVYPIWEAEKVG